MSKSDNEVFAVIVIVAIVCFLSGAILNDRFVTKIWRNDAITHGFAQYNPTNANFEWRTNFVNTNTVKIESK